MSKINNIIQNVKSAIIDKEIWLCILLLFPFIRIPLLVELNPLIGKIYTLLEVISLIVFIIYLKKKREKNIIDKSFYILLGLMVIYIFSTILNTFEIFKAVHNVYTIVAMYLIFNYYIKQRTFLLLKSQSIYYYLLIVINFILIVIFPNGMFTLETENEYTRYTQNWLLGYKNDVIIFLFAGIAFNCIYSYFKYNKLKVKDYVLLLICLLSVFFIKSTTSIIGISILVIFVILNLLKKDKNIRVDIRFVNIIFIVLFLLIVIFRVQHNFEDFIKTTFNKNATLTGRAYIWNDVYKFIDEKPVIGYGYEEGNYRLSKTEIYQAVHAHNQILEIIYKVGFLGLALVIAFYYISTKKLIRYKNYYIANFLSICIFSFFTMMITEFFYLTSYLYLLMLAMNIEVLLFNKENNKKVGIIKEEKVSIIVPVFNCEKYIEKCIQSLINQKYKNLEIIVVDDGSTDNSSKIINKFLNKDNRIKLISIENQGVSTARNIGIENASGKYITFVDSDDYVLDNYVEELLDNMYSYDVEIVFGNAVDVDDKYKKIQEKKLNQNYYMNKKQLIQELLLEDKTVCTCWGNLYKTEICKKIKFNNNMKICEDFEFLIKYLDYVEKGVIQKNNNYYYVVRLNSAVNGKFNNDRYDEIKYCCKLIEMYNNTELKKFCVRRLIRVIVDLLYQDIEIEERKKLKEYLNIKNGISMFIFWRFFAKEKD